LLKTDVKNLLAVGVDTVSIANSAKRAGYKVYAADYFGDLDLQRVCIECKSIIEQKQGKSCGKFGSKFKPKTFLEMAKSLLKKFEIDALLLSSGLDDYYDVLYELNDLVPILGNNPKVIERVREKPMFFEELKRLEIAHPETIIVKNVNEAKAAAVKLGYPVVIKPIRGFGGTGIRLTRDSNEVERAYFENSLMSENVLIQKFVDGFHASLSFLATDKDVKILSINEQLLGLPFVFQQEPFGYCGNIVPLHFANLIFEKCKDIAEKIALHFGLKGSNGIDLVISKDGTPHVVEVNPRFQGTLECVEKVLGINLVKSHIEACINGRLPTIKRRTTNFCTRLILYAPSRVMIPDLTTFREVRDVPFPEIIIEKGEPLCSIITEGNTRSLSFQKAKKLAKSIYRTLRIT
jgi:predicted ATP-grasp superfamily ATP-dependent carboligase